MEKLVKQIINRFFGSWTWPHNWVLKTVSLGFAIFLWFFVAGEDQVDMNVTIPVEFINLPQDMIISNNAKPQLEISLSGPQSLIRDIDSNNKHVTRTVDLSKAKPGTMVIKNNTDSIPLPWGVKLLRVKPTELILQLDRLIVKTFPLHAVTTGKVAEGYKLVSVMLEPAEVTITAPQTIIENEKVINTQGINLNGLTKSIITHTNLDVSPELAETIGKPVITASIVIEEKKIHKIISKTPLVLSNKQQEQGLKLATETFKVHTTITYHLAQKTKKFRDLIKPYILTSDLKPGTHEVKVNIYPVPGVAILEVQPETVSVTIPPQEPSNDKNKQPLPAVAK